MIHRIVFDVEIPSIGLRHNFLVPRSLQGKDVLTLIAKMLADEYGGIRCNADELRLICKENGKALDENLDMSQLGEKREEKFILI